MKDKNPHKLSFKQLKEMEDLYHEHRMEELEYVRATEKIKHQNELETNRIRNAEIRKNIFRQQQAREGKYRY